MKVKFSTQLKGVEDMKKFGISKARKVLFLTMDKMHKLAVQKVTTDRSTLKASIKLTPETPGSDTYVLSDGVEYGISIEFGTSPHFVPIAPLLEWSRRKLGDEGAAYAVRAKIAKEGTSAQPFFRPAKFEAEHIWLPMFKRQVFG